MQFSRRPFSRVPSALLSLLAFSCGASLPSRAPLTTIRAVKESLAREPEVAHPVELRGVVTIFDQDRGVLYLQDSTGALTLQARDAGQPAIAAKTVQVSGIVNRGSDLPQLGRARVTVVRPSRPNVMLEARRIRTEELLSRAAESEWVEVHGLVTEEVHSQSILLLLENEGLRFRAEILNRDPQYPSLVGSRLRLRGVSIARAHVRPGQEAVDLLVPDVEAVRIEEEPPPPPVLRSSLPPLTTAAQVRGLTPAEAAKAYPVRLRATVTLSEPELGLLFVQDETAGIYVEAWRHIHRVRSGDLVEVVGRSDRGAFAPIVDRPHVRVLRHGALSAARAVSAERLVTGQEDSQWVEVEGVVRAVDVGRDGATLRLAAGAIRIGVVVSGATDRALSERLVDARLRVRGVPRAVLTVWNQLADVKLHAPDLGSLTILKPPPEEPFDLPVQPVNRLLQFAPGRTWEHRVRVQGVVTHSRPGEVYLRDDSGSLYVQARESPPLNAGDEVDVIGFTTPGAYRPTLQDAALRRTGKGALPQPASVTPEEALVGRFDMELVTLEAGLLDTVRGPDEQQLLMRAGPYPFTAVLHGSQWEGVRAGSRLRLTGICAVRAGGYRVPQSFRLLLRTPADVQVLEAAPWWTLRRTAWALAVMGTIAGLALAWVVTLRRRLKAQSAVIWERVKRETELQERQRMARELHDTLEQNLAGIGLCVEAASRALPGKSKVAEQHLALAIQQVNAGVDEVRRSVWALRTQSLDTHGLAAALDEIGQQLARCSSTFVDIRTNAMGDARLFSVAVENDLLRIGQEALTNAVRHAQARRIEVELRYEEDFFRLRVSDDGRGFDAHGSPRPGHFGLVGMRERALAIGAMLDVRSTPNRGTDVEVTVPLSVRLRQVG